MGYTYADTYIVQAHGRACTLTQTISERFCDSQEILEILYDPVKGDVCVIYMNSRPGGGGRGGMEEGLYSTSLSPPAISGD